MLENNDSLYVSIDSIPDIDIGGVTNWGNFENNHVSALVRDSFHGLWVDKPYIINLNKIESIVGEWNKDKTEYGLHIFFASGNSVWIGKQAAEELLKYFQDSLGSEKLCDATKLRWAAHKFDDRSQK